MSVKTISGIVLVSKNPKALATFYKNVFGLTFTRESHGKLPTHYFTKIEGTRFIIHSPKGHPNLVPRQGSISLSFAVDSIDEISAKLKALKVEKLLERTESFGKRIEFRDLDGNAVNAVELST
mgnify:CR=1 FL=1